MFFYRAGNPTEFKAR